MSELHKKDVEHLAGLARLELSSDEAVLLTKDLEKILDHFEELKEVNTNSVSPLTGGTSLKNVAREDSVEVNDDTGLGKDQFPDANNDGFLKIPAVFSAEGGSGADGE
ncbi:MAG: Asp-tRNA(Asn)/Glu-tRNA(Gln) amidotransferase subunit GatC [bacterium]|nr:Asp-tRNA(Asn)/Glu-tRNA(Gln) amidotransferase subunit GatC [bacterium]